MTDVPIWTPRQWLLVFETRCDWRWQRFIPGRFKHVFAVGFVAAIDTWVIYSVERNGTHVGAFRPGEDFNRWLAGVIPKAGVLRMKRMGDARGMPWFTFWCVPAVKHALGLRGGALWPDQLWRYCLANGAEIVADADAQATDRGNRTREGEPARG